MEASKVGRVEVDEEWMWVRQWCEAYGRKMYPVSFESDAPLAPILCRRKATIRVEGKNFCWFHGKQARALTSGDSGALPDSRVAACPPPEEEK